MILDVALVLEAVQQHQQHPDPLPAHPRVTWRVAVAIQSAHHDSPRCRHQVRPLEWYLVCPVHWYARSIRWQVLISTCPASQRVRLSGPESPETGSGQRSWRPAVGGAAQRHA